ncbi:MAG: hypothetical protein WCK27_22485 [Verrucomicrobiota bacterium]|nr:hypothetical protein [Verrucomicrobiota bacterium]
MVLTHEFTLLRHYYLGLIESISHPDFRTHVQHGLLQTEGQWIILRSTLIPFELPGTLKSELDIAFY